MKLARPHTGNGDAFPQQSYWAALRLLVPASVFGAGWGAASLILLALLPSLPNVKWVKLHPQVDVTQGVIQLAIVGAVVWLMLWIPLFLGALPALAFREWIAAPRPPYVRPAYLGVVALALAMTVGVLHIQWDAHLLSLLVGVLPPQIAAYVTVRHFAKAAVRRGSW